MIFSLNLLYSLIGTLCISSYVVKCKRYRNQCFIVLFGILLIVPWVVICGSQFEVGTDYKEYYKIFKYGQSGLFYNKNEYLFAWIVDVGRKLNLSGQSLFYVFYTIGFYFFTLICVCLDKKTIFIFIIIYICVSNLFNNQLNGLRQSIAVYIVSFATIDYVKECQKVKFIILILVASLFHFSSWIALLVLFFANIRVSTRVSRLLIILALLFTLGNTIVMWRVIEILDSTIPVIYRHLLNGSMNVSVSILQLFPKLVWIPFYFRACRYADICVLNNRKCGMLFSIGILCYCFRICSWSNLILDRAGYVFVLISVFPLYQYWKLLYVQGKRKEFSFNMICCLMIYVVKTLVFPSKEYLYNSTWFNEILY